MAGGEQVDWSAPVDVPPERWAPQFRADAAALLAHWRSQPEDQAGAADFTTAELAVHAWDLAQAVDPGRALDPVVAERALAAMRQGLTPENRAGVFAPAVEVADDAPVHGPAGRLGGPHAALRRSGVDVWEVVARATAS